MLINWSPVVRLSSKPESTVEPTSEKRVRTQRTITAVKLWIMPLASMAAPKHLAQMMSQLEIIDRLVGIDAALKAERRVGVQRGGVMGGVWIS